jgi:hypothetical protein
MPPNAKSLVVWSYDPTADVWRALDGRTMVPGPVVRGLARKRVGNDVVSLAEWTQAVREVLEEDWRHGKLAA